MSALVLRLSLLTHCARFLLRSATTFFTAFFNAFFFNAFFSSFLARNTRPSRVSARSASRHKPIVSVRCGGCACVCGDELSRRGCCSVATGAPGVFEPAARAARRFGRLPKAPIKTHAQPREEGRPEPKAFGFLLLVFRPARLSESPSQLKPPTARPALGCTATAAHITENLKTPTRARTARPFLSRTAKSARVLFNSLYLAERRYATVNQCESSPSSALQISFEIKTRWHPWKPAWVAL